MKCIMLIIVKMPTGDYTQVSTLDFGIWHKPALKVYRDSQKRFMLANTSFGSDEYSEQDSSLKDS